MCSLYVQFFYSISLLIIKMRMKFPQLWPRLCPVSSNLGWSCLRVLMLTPWRSQILRIILPLLLHLFLVCLIKRRHETLNSLKNVKSKVVRGISQARIATRTKRGFFDAALNIWTFWTDMWLDTWMILETSCGSIMLLH